MSNATATETTLTAHDYQTGAELGELTAEQSAAYLAEIADDATGIGAVDGAPYGHPGRTIYAQ